MTQHTTELLQVPVTQTASQSLKPAPTASSPRADESTGPDSIVLVLLPRLSCAPTNGCVTLFDSVSCDLQKTTSSTQQQKVRRTIVSSLDQRTLLAGDLRKMTPSALEDVDPVGIPLCYVAALHESLAVLTPAICFQPFFF